MTPPTPSTPVRTLASGPLTVVIGASGIISINLAGQTLTTAPPAGAPTAQGFFCPSANFANLGSPVKQTMGNAGANVTIETTYPIALVNTGYSLVGTDLHLAVTVTNTGTTPLSNFAYAVTTLNFGANPTGELDAYNVDYIIDEPRNAYYPCVGAPAAGRWVHAANYGVCFHSPSHFNKYHLWNAFNATAGGIPSTGAIHFYAQDSVAPGAQVTFNLVIHFTPSAAVADVVSSYLDDIVSYVGPAQYQPTDARPIMQFTSIDPGAGPAENPYNYTGNNLYYRLDLEAGIAAYQAMVAPLAGLAQGIIFWQPQGSNPRGAPYRPDFDIWPIPQQATLPELFKGLIKSGFAVGLCVRPSCIVTSLNETTDTVIERSADDPAQMAALFTAFANVMKFGHSMFYADSFGMTLNDIEIAKQTREDMLFPTNQIYSEYMLDQMIPLCGMYAEPSQLPGAVLDGGTSHYSAEMMQVFQLLANRCGITLPVLFKCDIVGITPSVEFLLAHKYIPLLFDGNSQVGGVNQKLCEQFNAELNKVTNYWE